MISANPIPAFLEAIAGAGWGCPDQVIADGRIHRYRGKDDKPGTKDAWYILHLDGVAAGAYGHWKHHPDAINWHERGESISPEQRAEFAQRVKEAKAKRDAEDAADHAAAAKRAQELLDNTKKADPDHPYLCRKQVGTHGIRESQAASSSPVTFDLKFDLNAARSALKEEDE